MTRYPASPTAIARPTIRQAAGAVASAAALALAGCSSTAPDVAEPPVPSAATPNDPPSVAPTEKLTDPGPSESELVATLWQDYHAAYLDELASDQPDPAAFQGLAVDPDAIADQLTAELDALGNHLVTVEVEHAPQVDIVADGQEAAVTDCVIVSQYPAARGEDATATSSATWHATIVAVDGGWLVQSAAARGHLCIPEALNEVLIRAYDGWTDARKQWFDPPDPDHPLLDQVMAEPGRTDMRETLASLREQGLVGRDARTSVGAAVVTELGIGTATITDCYPAEFGGVDALDAETGEPRPELNPEAQAGANIFVTLDLARGADGVWRATGWNFGRNSACEPGDSVYAVV